VNEGCIPTKTLLRSAEVMHLVKHRAHAFGVRGVNPDAVTFDLAAAVARKDAIVKSIIDGIYTALRRNKHITFFTGHAELTSPVDIRVDGRQITAEKTILAVGAHPATVDIPGLAEVGYITNDEALKLERLPASMIVIGAGYIGVEFAQMYARFGTKVTMLGRARRVMPHEDEEVSAALAEVLRAEGTDLYTSAPVLRAEREGGEKVVVAQIGGEERRFRADVILFAGGRVSRVDELGLDQAGVELEGGVIRVGDTLLTTAPNIWSIGDANGGAMFTHRATYDGPIAALNAVRGLKKKIDYRVVPRAVFSEPAVASVGLTEREAREAGHEVREAISRLFTFAAWTDKYDGSVHSVNVPHRDLTIAIHEPVGVIGIACPDEMPLLAFVTLVGAAIAMGNTVITVPSEAHPLAATDLYQVFDTSDLPAGVVNIVTGSRDDLARVLAQHDDVDAVWYFGPAEGRAMVETESATNMKRTWVSDGRPRTWTAAWAEGDQILRHAVQVKNIWVPYGA